MWVKIDDQFAEHPKMVGVGPLGMAMQVAALCYCNRHLTDGFVPRGKVPGLIDLTGLVVTWEQVVAMLLEPREPHGPVWVQVPGGYQIHDYFDYQPSREEVLSDHQQKSDAGRKGAEARWKGAKQAHGTDHGTCYSTCHGRTVAEPMAESCPVPVPEPDNVERTTPKPPPGGAAAELDKGRSRRAMDPRTPVVLEYYRRLFRARFGKDPFIEPRKDGRIVSQLLATYTPERLWNFLQSFFTDDEPYIMRRGHSLSVFRDQVNRYLLSEGVHEIYRTQTIRAPSTPEAIRRVLEAQPGGDMPCLTN